MGAESGGGVQVDIQSGVFGHRVTMADSDPEGLARLRHVIAVVNIPDAPPEVTTALALSGSAAQGRIQRFPADCDFFERVHIRAATREAAIDRLGETIRDKALATVSGAGLPAVGGQVGQPRPSRHRARRRGPARSLDLVDARRRSSPAPRSSPCRTGRSSPSNGGARPADPAGPSSTGWSRTRPVASSRTRRTSSTPPGRHPTATIVPLDGFLDPYFQEVYLEAESIPLFTRLVKELGADSVADYVEQLEGEVRKYTVSTPNHGKAARRMYNVFRLTGRYPEAAYVRELFDEPVSALYQLAALLQTIADASTAGGEVFDRELLLTQVDQLIVSAIAALDGPEEALMVDRLTPVPGGARGWRPGAPGARRTRAGTRRWSRSMHYFRRTLRAVPSIDGYLDEIASRPA